MQLIQNGTQISGPVTPPAPAAPSGTPNYGNNATPGPLVTPTDWDADTANAVLAELVNFVVATGLALSPGTFTQVLQSAKRMAGGNYLAISATPGSPLTADNAGLIVVDATAGNVSITLPASNSANAVPLRFRFARTDATTHTVSIAFHSGDTTLLGGMAGPLALNPLAVLDLVGDGGTHWLAPPMGGFPSAAGALSASTSITIAYAGQYIEVTGAATTQTLVAPAGVPGMTVGFLAGTACTVAIAGGGAFLGGLIGGSSSVALPQYAWLSVQSDGTNWRVLGASANIMGYAPLASPAFTGSPTAPTAATGTNTTQLATTANVLASCLGTGAAAWNDVSGSRAIGVVYTNSHGKPIDVLVNVGSTSSMNSQAFVAGVQIFTGPTVASATGSPVAFTVPTGATYEVTISAGTPSLISWMELY